MVDYIRDVSKLLQGFRAYSFGPDVPPELADQLQKIPGTDADVICDASEMLYAHRELLNEQGLTVMAQLFNYAHEQGWSDFNRNGRSREIVTRTAEALAGESAPADQWPEPETARRAGTDWRTPASE